MDRSQTRWTLASKLALGILITVALPLVVFSIITFFINMRTFEDYSRNSGDVVAQLKAAELDQAILSLENQVESLVLNTSGMSSYRRALQTLDTINAEELNNAFRNLRDIEGIRHIALYSRQHSSILAQQGSDTIILTSQDISFLNDLQNTQLMDIYASRNRQNVLLDLAVPLHNATSTVILGELIVTLDVNQISNNSDSLFINPLAVLQQQPRFEDVPEMYVGLLNRSGALLAASEGNQNPLLANLNYPEHPFLQTDAEGQLRLQDRDYTSPLSQQNVIGHAAQVGKRNLVLVTELNHSDILSPVLSLMIPAIVSGLLIVLLGNILWNTWVYRSIEARIRSLMNSINTFSLGEPVSSLSPVTNPDEIDVLQNAFLQMTNQANASYELLQNESYKQSLDWQVALKTAQMIQQLHKSRFLSESVLRLLRDEIPEVNYVQLFLVDKSTDVLKLDAATGDLGRRLLAQAYYQPFTMENVVGRVALSAQSIVIPNLTKESFYRQSELFSDSFSELLVPLLVEEQVIGVLDIHSQKTNAFSEQDLQLFRIIAAQLTTVLAEDTSNTGTSTILADALASPRNFLQKRVESLSARAGRPIGPESDWTALQKQAMASGKVLTSVQNELTTFAIPIRLRNDILGAVELTIENARFNPTLLQTAEALVNRLALAIDNARLFEQSQRLVERERLVNTITQKLTAQTDVRQILQVAVRELGQALGTPETQISLKIEGQQHDAITN